jgi:hypothetical protein
MVSPVTNSAKPVSFSADIKPLFRPIDIEHMSWLCDLSKYDDVRDHAQAILTRLKAAGPKLMPPANAGGPWTPQHIALFESWMKGGYAQ